MRKEKLIPYLTLGLPFLAYLIYPFLVGPEIRASWKPMLVHCAYISVTLTMLLLALNPLLTFVPGLEPFKSLNRYRRGIGVAAFAYAALHVLSIFARVIIKKGYFPWSAFVIKPIYFTGAVVFVIFLLLALTSNRLSTQWLGGRRWKRLHNWVYVAEVALLIHMLLRGKKAFIIALCVLLPLMALQYARHRKLSQARIQKA